MSSDSSSSDDQVFNSGADRYNPYTDLAKKAGDTTKVRFFTRAAEPGPGHRPDSFLADAPMTEVDSSDPRVKYLIKLFEECLKDETSKKVHCDRCVTRGLPCIVRAFLDENGRLQIYYS